MRQRLFIAVEGLDGSGKSLLVQRLSETLKQNPDIGCVATQEPDKHSAAGPFIRQVLDKVIPSSNHMLALAFALNRSHHTSRVINAFLDNVQDPRVRIVLCDRYLLSSLAYQADGKQLTLTDIMEMNREARTPDLTLFLDATPETCYGRVEARQRGKSFELFDHRISEMRVRYEHAILYLKLRGHQIVTLDANQSPDHVYTQAIDALYAHAPWLAQAQPRLG